MTKLKLFWGRVVCWWKKDHAWAGEGMPVARPGHRSGYAQVRCLRCLKRSTFELSRDELAAARQAYAEATKLRLVR